MPSIWLLTLLLLPAHSPDGMTASHVRGVSLSTRLLIEDLAAQSVIVRQLLARLGCTDVIVYVEMTASPQIPRARTKLVTSTAGARFLRIGISVFNAPAEVAALLAHELQHAVEIAEEDEVRDEDGVRRLYQRIGRAGPSDSFETEAAIDVELSVRAELHSRRF